jgi:xanthine dehydrogenase accessory factor
MRELLSEYLKMKSSGPVGRAVVTNVWGSAPRPEGSNLLATTDHAMAGSVSGGCVENAVVEEIIGAIQAGAPKTLEYGVTHERAWEFGLSCGGTISLLVEPTVRPELVEAAKNPEASVVATVIAGAAPLGSSVVVRENGTTENRGVPERLREAITESARKALSRASSFSDALLTDAGEVRVLYEVFARRPTLLVFGGVHVAMPLVKLAKLLGYRTVVADGREAFLTRERFPEADELMVGWPDEVFAKAGIDSATCICVLTHDPKFDEPALDIALRSPAAYVGAIGSRKTQALRRERLAKAGFTPEEIARLHGPIGLDLGGRDPAEIALSILAEITAVRHGGRAARPRSPAGVEVEAR